MREDPLLTDRTTGAMGRAIVGLPMQIIRALFVILCFIPVAFTHYEGDVRLCFIHGLEFIVWGEGGRPIQPEPPAPPKLSIRAQKLYQRMLEGAWYRWGDTRTPQAMAELDAAGLVGTMGRVETIVRCWVPAGSEPFQLEKIKA